MDENDATVEVEDEGGAPLHEEPKSADFGAGMNASVLTFIESYGWFLLLGVVLFIYIRARVAMKMSKPRNEGIEYEGDVALERQAAMDAARAKMQARHTVQADKFAEQQKIKDEEKRRQKIEEWEKHQAGMGYHSKYRPSEEASNGTNTSKSAKTTKKPLRNSDYNPLTGDGGSCSWRPAGGRGGGAGGGGGGG